MSAEETRLEEEKRRKQNWKRWGPYLSERQWATVREDYSADGTVWDYFPHDHARSRSYRWGEDGILGITDRECRLCFALCLWNEKDSILKERLFGLTGPEGNHGEDVKECYFYLDSTPTHSYMKGLYKYPQNAFPYNQLIEENERRGLADAEFELTDTGIFDDGRYFDIFVEYAKGSPNDILLRIKIANRSSSPARLHLLPTLWFRNTWSWGCTHDGCTLKPTMQLAEPGLVTTWHETLGDFHLAYEPLRKGVHPEPLFTENETDFKRIFGSSNSSRHVKDAFHNYLINSDHECINKKNLGTKFAPHYVFSLEGSEQRSVRLRLFSRAEKPHKIFGNSFDSTFDERKKEADEFYDSRIHEALTEEERLISRQAFAGLLWSKQFYHYVVDAWLKGDPGQPEPPVSRLQGKNHDWRHLFSRDVISMPDKWEYPWFAAWDLAFHMIPFSEIDPDFAKNQLILFLREWYMHPNGQIPAYEFAFGDVNPPVHAWAAWRTYKISARRGKRDRAFLESVFQKLLLNFTFWVNRKDRQGNHIFSGGFLGLDNIGVFDRSKDLPTGGFLEQSDGTAWMAFYCLTMLSMALELASEDPVYEDMASKFFEHFVHIADAINNLGGQGLWDDTDGFYYDKLNINGSVTPMRARSIVGLLPLIAVGILDDESIARLTGFKKRMNWFIENRKDLFGIISACECHDQHNYRMLSIPSRPRLVKLLSYMLDENEFLSPYGIRSVSKIHKDQPFIYRSNGQEYRIDYAPGESTTLSFGGNSNWRGPVWFPINYLIIEALERYYHFYGDTLTVECPTGSNNYLNLFEVARELSRRLASLFLARPDGTRPCHGANRRFAVDPYWKDLLLFHEYFHADSGQGLGASHQTGWTSLVVRTLEHLHESSRNRRAHFRKR